MASFQKSVLISVGVRKEFMEWISQQEIAWSDGPRNINVTSEAFLNMVKEMDENKDYDRPPVINAEIGEVAYYLKNTGDCDVSFYQEREIK